jgi:hypothetical protein
MWPHDGRSPTDVDAPQPIGYCDRCYCRRYLADLLWQFDVRGNTLQNLWIRVCADKCYDEPANILRPIIIVGPEGFIRDPRPPNYAENFAGGTTPPADIGQFLFGYEEIPPDEGDPGAFGNFTFGKTPFGS